MAALDREIHELPRATEITDDGLFPVEQNGEAQSLTGALLKAWIDRNVVDVQVVTSESATTITATFDETTGILVLTVPAQMVDSYSKTEVNNLLAALLVPANHVVVTETQRLDALLPIETDEGKYIRQRVLSRTAYNDLVLRGATEADVLYWPYDVV